MAAAATSAAVTVTVRVVDVMTRVPFLDVIAVHGSNGA